MARPYPVTAWAVLFGALSAFSLVSATLLIAHGRPLAAIPPDAGPLTIAILYASVPLQALNALLLWRMNRWGALLYPAGALALVIARTIEHRPGAAGEPIIAMAAPFFIPAVFLACVLPYWKRMIWSWRAGAPNRDA